MDLYALLPLLVFALILAAGRGPSMPTREWSRLPPCPPAPPPDYSGLPVAVQAEFLQRDLAMAKARIDAHARMARAEARAARGPSPFGLLRELWRSL